MELREPPLPRAPLRADPLLRILVALNLAAIVGLGVWLVTTRDAGAGPDPERTREVAGRLLAAGALEESAALFEDYLAAALDSRDERARVAYSLGVAYLEAGRFERALRWFYEAEALGAGGLRTELDQKVVHTLERLGRTHAAKAALGARSGLEASPERPASDPVVARIGGDEIRRSDVDRALDGLPPELAARFAGAAERGEFLRKYVADELIWRRARRLEYDRDPEVLRRHEEALKQLVVGRFVEAELLAGLTVDEADLRTYFEAHRDRYRQAGPDGGDGEPTFEQVRRAVEADYRLFKLQSAYEELVERELAAETVEVFPERMVDGD